MQAVVKTDKTRRKEATHGELLRCCTFPDRDMAMASRAVSRESVCLRQRGRVCMEGEVVPERNRYDRAIAAQPSGFQLHFPCRIKTRAVGQERVLSGL